MWEDAIPSILPEVLQCIASVPLSTRFVSLKLTGCARHAHAFNNPSTWSKYPPEMHGIIKRILMDRVWQSGISNETRDDFFARVRDSKNTLEGLASAIRGAVRSVRELSYWIVHCMTSFGRAFYGHSDLPEPLARALYTDAQLLSAHQFSALLKLSTALVDGCPEENQSQFLTPLLILLFQQMDAKVMSEWGSIEQRKGVSTEEDNLGQEMKDESILRQLTYSAVTLVSNLFEPLPPGQSPFARSRFLINVFGSCTPANPPRAYPRHTHHPRATHPLLHARPRHSRYTLLLPHHSYTTQYCASLCTIWTARLVRTTTLCASPQLPLHRPAPHRHNLSPRALFLFVAKGPRITHSGHTRRFCTPQPCPARHFTLPPRHGIGREW